ncbi:MAG: hypothetical protein HY363_05375 [Candidatus Aenigmarchaeota archaeon]|nr:hypothetical protein [Candidatus Aenigmarchaeota archaeon]
MKYLNWLILIILTTTINAQIDQEVLAKQGDVCGNGVREHFELCDDPAGKDAGLCGEAGKLLKIAMVCHPKTCGCIPYKNKDCGNGIVEGSEFCDPPGQLNACADLGKIINIDLECNPTSCMCQPAKGIVYGVGFEPIKEEEKPKNLCGNRALDAGEKCDPPGRTCYYEDKGLQIQGICETNCSCGKIPESEPPIAQVETKTTPQQTQNITNKTEITEKQEEPLKQTENSEKKNRSAVRVVLGIIILSAVGFLTYFFYRKKDSQNNDTNPLDEMEETEKNEQV